MHVSPVDLGVDEVAHVDLVTLTDLIAKAGASGT